MCSATVEDEQLESKYSVQLWKMSNCSAICNAVWSAYVVLYGVPYVVLYGAHM